MSYNVPLSGGGEGEPLEDSDEEEEGDVGEEELSVSDSPEGDEEEEREEEEEEEEVEEEEEEEAGDEKEVDREVGRRLGRISASDIERIPKGGMLMGGCRSTARSARSAGAGTVGRPPQSSAASELDPAAKVAVGTGGGGREGGRRAGRGDGGKGVGGGAEPGGGNLLRHTNTTTQAHRASRTAGGGRDPEEAEPEDATGGDPASTAATGGDPASTAATDVASTMSSQRRDKRQGKQRVGRGQVVKPDTAGEEGEEVQAGKAGTGKAGARGGGGGGSLSALRRSPLTEEEIRRVFEFFAPGPSGHISEDSILDKAMDLGITYDEEKVRVPCWACIRRCGPV